MCSSDLPCIVADTQPLVGAGRGGHAHLARALHPVDARDLVVGEQPAPAGVGMNHHLGHQLVDGRAPAALGDHDALAALRVTLYVEAVIDAVTGRRSLAACGFPLVLIETVGTGQSEVEIASVADTTLVVQSPEMGDEIQAIKAGLLEVADVVAVTKGDRPGADLAASQLRAMLTVGAQHDRARRRQGFSRRRLQ